MEEVGKILPVVFKRQLQRSEASLLELLTPLWPRIVGKALARQCRPVAFGGGTLTIATSCPTWAMQFRQLSEEVRASVNRALGSEFVKKLRVHQDPTVDCVALPDNEALKPSPASHEADWPGSALRLEPEVAGTLARSYAKYFARGNRKVHGWR